MLFDFLKPTKTCTKCGKKKNTNEFHRHASSPDGLYPSCKDCVSDYNKLHRAEHRERLRQQDREYYRQNREQVRAGQKQYRLTHKEQVELQKKEWEKANPDKVKEIARKYRESHKEQRREYYNHYADEHPGWLASVVHRRRTLVKGGGNFTDNEWKQLCQKYSCRCLACGEKKPLTVDHVIPLSKGGTNTIENIQPLCKSCNSKKNNKAVDYRK